MNSGDKIVIYSRSGCSRCNNAELFLNKKEISFSKEDIDKHRTRILRENPQIKKLPVVEVNEKVIGSYEELVNYIKG